VNLENKVRFIMVQGVQCETVRKRGGKNERSP
jgi:hypothetical protein